MWEPSLAHPLCGNNTCEHPIRNQLEEPTCGPHIGNTRGTTLGGPPSGNPVGDTTSRAPLGVPPLRDAAWANHIGETHWATNLGGHHFADPISGSNLRRKQQGDKPQWIPNGGTRSREHLWGTPSGNSSCGTEIARHPLGPLWRTTYGTPGGDHGEPHFGGHVGDAPWDNPWGPGWGTTGGNNFRDTSETPQGDPIGEPTWGNNHWRCPLGNPLEDLPWGDIREPNFGDPTWWTTFAETPPDTLWGTLVDSPLGDRPCGEHTPPGIPLGAHTWGNFHDRQNGKLPRTTLH